MVFFCLNFYQPLLYFTRHTRVWVENFDGRNCITTSTTWVMLSVVFILFRFKYNREPNCRNVSFHLLFVLPDFGFYGFYRALLNWPFFIVSLIIINPFFFIYSFNRRSLRIKQYFLLFTIFNIITKIELNSITHSNSKVHAFDSEEEQKSWVNRLKCQTNPIKIINYTNLSTFRWTVQRNV